MTIKPKVYIHRGEDWYPKYMGGGNLQYLESFAEVVTEGERAVPLEKAELVEHMKGARAILSLNGVGADEIDNEVLKAVGTVELIVISHWWAN